MSLEELNRPGPITEVEWIDSGGSTGWHPPEQSAQFHVQLCRSVGYLIEDSERGVVLVAGNGQTGQHMDSICIPRVNVKWLRKVEETQ